MKSLTKQSLTDLKIPIIYSETFMIEFYKNKIAELEAKVIAHAENNELNAVKKLNSEIDNYKLAIKQLGCEL